MMFLFNVALLVDAPNLAETPTTNDVAAAVERYPFARGRAIFRTDTIKSMRCKAFDEEPTEFLCKFRAWDIGQSRWTRRSVIVTFDKEWLVLGMD